MTHITPRSVRNQSARLAAAIEPLEQRLLLTSLIVNTTADSADAPGGTVISLRDAIKIASSSATATAITFSPSTFATAKTITLSGKDLEISGKQPVTITGPAAGVTVNGNMASGDFVIDKGATATITGLTITGAQNEDSGGGGIQNNGSLTVKSCTITGDFDGFGAGGGIANYATLVVTASTISNCGAPGSGGAIENNTGAGMTLTNVTISGNFAFGPGGIDNNGTATLYRVTVSGNQATGVATPGGSSPGSVGGIGNSGAMTLIDCTVSNNSAGDSAGGIGNYGKLTLADSTVTANHAGGGFSGAYGSQTEVVGSGGGLYIDKSSLSTVVENSIIAGNQIIDGKGPDVAGAAQSSGYNIIGQTDGSTGWKSTDLTGTSAHPLNAVLSPMGFFGGPIQTFVPLAGSPAIDHGSNTLIPAGITTDQRGFARIVNGKVDIGAVESQAASVITITTPDFQDVLAGVPTSITLGSFTDPAGKGPFTVHVIWGDGSPDSSFVVSAAGSLGSLTHTFTTTHSFDGTILVSDASGDVSKPATLFVASVGVSGTVFEDDNSDGSQEKGEIGLRGVQVYADLGNVGYFVSGDPTAITDSNGVYTLEGLSAGSYIIRQIQPSGFAQTYPTKGLGFHVTLVVGRVLPTQNFGDRFAGAPASEITGTVFNDANGDGTQNNGESGLAGVQVYADLGNVGYFVTGDPTTTTNTTGGYTLSGLAAGNYIIRQAPPSGYVQTAPGNGFGHHVTVSAGETLSGQNFGDKA